MEIPGGQRSTNTKPANATNNTIIAGVFNAEFTATGILKFQVATATASGASIGVGTDTTYPGITVTIKRIQ